MSWAKLDDGMWSHPKFLDLSNGAIGVWAKALSWSAQQLSDGVLPRSMKLMLRATDGEVAELVHAGLWDETDTGWEIHDYLEFNPRREAVLVERNKGKARAQKSYDRRTTLRAKSETRCESSAKNSGVSSEFFADSSGDPSRPVPSRPVPENSQESESARTREASGRFEIVPVGEAPPNTPPSEPKPISPEARCWQLYQKAIRTDHLLLPMTHHEALSVLSSAAKAEASGVSHGEAFDRAAQRLLGAWMAEDYWQKKRPGLPNLADRIRAGLYAKPRTAQLMPVRKLSELSDEEFFAQARKQAGAT